ncbi:restriction endonuclease subunit S, partial [Metamycoplasma neophronis]
WEQCKLKEILKYERPEAYMISGDISEKGNIPVLTANKAFILGFTNEKNFYNHGESIIFDDFTLDYKYVDFIYKINSSAIKILTSIANKNLKFIYYLLSNVKIISNGHARHYISIVQNSIVNICSSEEDKKITAFLSTLDSLITLHQRKLEKLSNIKKSLLEKMFADEQNMKPQIRFKGFTDTWEQCKLKEILKYERPEAYMISGDISEKGNIPVLTANKAFILGFTNEKNFYNHGESIIFDDFTLDYKYVDFIFKINSSAIKILTSIANKNLKFIYYLLSNVKIISNGHARHYISIVQNSIVNICSSEEDKKITAFLSTLDSLITLHQRKLEKLNNIKKSLLEKMFC